MKNAFRLLITFMVVVFFTPSKVLADVDLRSGSYHAEYTDAVLRASVLPAIKRFYNSADTRTGLFGRGWSSNLESRVTRLPDGNLLLQERGCAKELVFYPEVSEMAEDEKDVMDDGEAQEHAESEEKPSLSGDEKRYRAGGCDGYQYLVESKQGFLRVFQDKRTEQYDVNGRLQRLDNQQGQGLVLLRNREGQLTGLADSRGRKFTIRVNQQGLVSEIDLGDGIKAEYQYSDKGELLQAKGSHHENVFVYYYDDHHRLTTITEHADLVTHIEYAGTSPGAKVNSVSSSDQVKVTYTYTETGMNLTVIESVAIEGSEETHNTYQFFIDKTEEGRAFLAKKIEMEYGQLTETEYNSCCMQPLAIRRDNNLYSYEYDDNSRVVKKIGPSSTDVMQYDETTGLISSYARYFNDSQEISWSGYGYDEKGNLVDVTNSEGIRLRLGYDRNGNISLLKNAQDNTEITFSYNKMGKPEVIRVKNVGQVKVTYDKHGEILNVDSSGGAATSLEIVGMFQQFLKAAKPGAINYPR